MHGIGIGILANPEIDMEGDFSADCISPELLQAVSCDTTVVNFFSFFLFFFSLFLCCL